MDVGLAASRSANRSAVSRAPAEDASCEVDAPPAKVAFGRIVFDSIR